MVIRDRRLCFLRRRLEERYFRAAHKMLYIHGTRRYVSTAPAIFTRISCSAEQHEITLNLSQVLRSDSQSYSAKTSPVSPAPFRHCNACRSFESNDASRKAVYLISSIYFALSRTGCQRLRTCLVTNVQSRRVLRKEQDHPI